VAASAHGHRPDSSSADQVDVAGFRNRSRHRGNIMSDNTRIGSGPGLLRSIAHRLAGDDALQVEGSLGSFDGATGWLNSGSLTPESLRGRIVLVDFWTYTCVNWLRTLPYLRAWHTKYRDAGLTIVGVHTPEFAFERDLDNVTSRVDTLGVEYPVAIDSDYGVWRAFGNHFWPAVYIADPQGRIRFHHFGEEAYPQQEMMIQQLLLGAGVNDVDQDLVMPTAEGLQLGADWRNVRSREAYTGYRQSRGFAQESVASLDGPHRYAGPGHSLSTPGQ
jgi:thiol-disulfide isomerase/thioredoxin